MNRYIEKPVIKAEPSSRPGVIKNENIRLAEIDRKVTGIARSVENLSADYGRIIHIEKALTESDEKMLTLYKAVKKLVP